jgi:hypothetical protein
MPPWDKWTHRFQNSLSSLSHHHMVLVHAITSLLQLPMNIEGKLSIKPIKVIIMEE